MTHEQKTESGIPDPHPMIGHAYKFLDNTEGFYAACTSSSEDVLRVELGPKVFRYVTSPELVNEILFEREDQFKKSEWFRQNMKDFWGDALIIRDGERWRKQRKRLQPLFEPSRVESHVETFVREARTQMDRWRRGNTYALGWEMEELSLRLVLNFLFGRTLDHETERKIIKDFRHLTAKFDIGSIAVFLPKWVPVSTNRKYIRALNALESEIETILQEQKGTTDSQPTCLVGTLLNAMGGDPADLTKDVIRDEMLSFLFEHRTIAAHLTFTLYLLADYPEKQTRVQDELAQELGGEPPVFADLNNLSYLNDALRESLRLYPPVHTMFREPTGPIEFGGEHLDSDSILVLSPYIFHRDGNVYDNPNEFRPRRWEEDYTDAIPRSAYVPFGGGPHHCIGMRLSTTIARATISTILQDYDVSLADDGLDGLKFATPLGTQSDVHVTFS